MTTATDPHISHYEPDRDCSLCPRLHDFIGEWREKEPQWHNAPVSTWSAPENEDVHLLIVGLAPGLRGANRTGRPFTGDFAGDLLYATLTKFGFAQGQYRSDHDDNLMLTSCAITNAVRCVPPQNKPVGAEINNCRSFLQHTIARFPNLEAIVTLGKIAHDSTIRALGHKVSAYPFSHNAAHRTDRLTIRSSYHCSRYNTNTGRLTPDMFETVFAAVQQEVHSH